MKVNIKKFQEGGAMAPQAAPAQDPAAAQQDPIMQIAQMAAQALQAQDCNMAMQVCQVFVQMLQQSQGAPAEEQPAEPVYRRGGTLVRRVKA